jgi:hypothetical protein
LSIPPGKAEEPQSVFERAIILRATDMTLGTLTTNMEQVLAAVQEKSREYRDVTKYEGDDKQARKDLALIRKQKETTKTIAASIQQAWNKPLEPFLSGIREIYKQFDYSIEAIDDWVKEGASREKEAKRREIQAYFDGKGFDLAPLDMFFDDRWLNKGYKLTDVKKEIDTKISEIYGNIKILESISGHGMTAKAFYLETLDMGEAMRKVELLKANAELLAREEVNRQERERHTQVALNAAGERREEYQAARDEQVRSLAGKALDIEEPGEAAAPRIIEYTLRFRGTEPQLLKLREYMTANGIAYEKL